MTTASTPDDIHTPDSTGLTGFHFHIDENPVKGPVGPHLFRHSDEFSEMKELLGVDLMVQDTPLSATTPFYRSASKIEPERRGTPLSDGAPKKQKESKPVSKDDKIVSYQPPEDDVANWAPQDVVVWMQNLGFEEGIVEKFFINDITGAILLELQGEDLKELDIQSFGKRHRLMGAIRQLQSCSTPVPSCDGTPDPTAREDTATPKTTAGEVGVSECASPLSEGKSKSKSRSGSSQSRRRRHKRRHGTDLVPEDSVSIVAIEQLLPALHTCSKGENCRKWQKQQAKLARLAKGLPVECYGGSVVIGDPGNAATAPNLAKTPKSDVTPSLIASSDVLGPNHPTDVPQLSRDKLGDVEPRDPQENVRNFLNFQRLSRLQPVTDPATPPRENFPSPDSNSPGSAKANNATLSENLRHLPRLQIPNARGSTADSTFSPNYSADRTITPSIVHRKAPFTQRNTHKSPYPTGYSPSPSDFYRQDPYYGRSTPLSEMDVPTTAIPLGQAARMFSQSVPPDMRFGGHHIYHLPDPILRPTSTKAENHKRPGFNLNGRPLARLDERSPLPPIETPEDMDRTPRAAHCKSNPFSPSGQFTNDIIHSGWMKKRKTSKLLRHEWEDHHFTLRGTRLAMHADEVSAHRASKALEHIDVDDYAVACSSLPSNSKLTAAFKKTVLKRKDNSQGEAAFAFSLIPSPSNSTFDRKTIFVQGPKAHHFAVKTRDERIDWMRELMLAKALRRGRESGATLNVNGTAF